MEVEADRAQTTTELFYTTCQFLNATMFAASSLQYVSSTKGVVASRRASQRRENYTAGRPAYVGHRSVQVVVTDPKMTAAIRNVSTEILTLILRRSRTGTVWFYTSTSNKRAARPKLYTKSLTRDLKLMYSSLTLVRISIKL